MNSIYEPLKYIGREVCWANDGFYEVVAHLRGEPVLKCDPAKFDLFVSGFPRSGNHFYRSLITLMTKGAVESNPVNHYPPYVRKAAKRGVNSVLLVRNPLDACASWSTYNNVSVEHSLRFYLQFHRLIKSVLTVQHVACFERFIKEPIDEMHALSRCYDLPFDQSLVQFNNEQFAEKITREIPVWEDKNQSPFPDGQRQAMNQLNKERILSKSNESLLKEAMGVYESLVV